MTQWKNVQKPMVFGFKSIQNDFNWRFQINFSHVTMVNLLARLSSFFVNQLTVKLLIVALRQTLIQHRTMIDIFMLKYAYLLQK